MKVSIVKMCDKGVELERRMLNDRHTYKFSGDLVIMDVTDQGRHRPVKVARLVVDRTVQCELIDVHVVWASGNRITFTGAERVATAGKHVSYVQSWLCELDTATPEAVASALLRQDRKGER